MRAHRLTGSLAVAAFVSACTCSKEEPLRTDFPEPRPARAVEPIPDAGPVVFRVASQSTIEFSLPARDGTPRGVVESVEGELQVNPIALAESRGVVRADLASLTMTSGATEDGGSKTDRAKNWLELGRGRADHRFATFEVHRLNDLSQPAAHAGKLESSASAADGGDGETRRIDLTAEGSLTLHGRRADQAIRLSARFDFPAPALTGVMPTRITIESDGPLLLPLETYDLVPRAADGTVISRDLALLGKKIGRKVKVTVRLVLEPAR